MKIINILFCILFVISAALQYNDPDPYVWVPIYLYGAWLCFEYSRQKYYPKLYLLGIFVYLIYAAFLFFDKTGVINWYEDHQAENIAMSMKASKPWIEETREFGGLLILVVVLVVDYFASRRNAKAK